MARESERSNPGGDRNTLHLADFQDSDFAPGRYFFHLESNDGVVSDEDGMFLSSFDAVCAEAFRGARWIVAAARLTGRTPTETVYVEDEDGRKIYEVGLQQFSKSTINIASDQ